MNIKRFYKNHPYINASGSYTFKDGNNSNEYQNSDSVPLKFDKFRRNDLYTTYTGDSTNEKIIQSYFDEKNQILNNNGNPITRLKYNSPSFVSIDSLYIDFNSNDIGRVKNVDFYGFMVNELALQQNSNEILQDDDYNILSDLGLTKGVGQFGDMLSPIKKADGTFKTFEQMRQLIYYQNDNASSTEELDGDKRTLDEVGEFLHHEPSTLDSSDVNDVPGYVMQNAQILTNLNDGEVRSSPTVPDIQDRNEPAAHKGPEARVGVYGSAGKEDNFRPREVFYVSNSDGNTRTKIFDEGTNGQLNTIYFIFYLRGDKSGGSNRKRRIHIYEINPLELFIRDDVGNIVGGKITEFNLGEGIMIDESARSLIPAFKITEFKLTINTLSGAGAGYNPNDSYADMTLESILPPQNSQPININNIDENILSINPFRELESEPNLPSAENIPIEYSDFIPTSHVKIKNTSQDVQIYYESEIEKQRASAPTTVEIDFTISNTTTDKSQLKDRRTDIVGNEDESSFIFTVVDWNDVDNKYETIQDVMSDFPTTMIELNNKRKDNLFYFNDIYKPLFNNYSTSGIKNIKVLVFNYITDNNDNIEPTRWKLVTSRIFLDIPINQFPDFGEVGGADYTTIPWPYTTPIISGLSENSKYLKSIDDVLGGGKIGNHDIIDETFLVDARENDELGANIQVMDLEQVRFFNQSYDMNTLLNIPIENDFYPNPYTNIGSDSYWNGSSIERTFSEESSVGQIFITENQDNDLKQNCKLELNMGELIGKSITDSSGNANKGLLIGDYKVKKTRKGEPMRRDSFIKVPKKTGNKDGAL